LPKDDAPPFGSQLGYLYPLVWRILSINRYFSPSMWLPRRSGLAIDVYVTLWWLIECAVVAIANSVAWRGWFPRIALLLLGFRLLDVYFALFSNFLKGYYRRSSDILSARRVLLLSVMNAVEVMFVFGVLYRGCSVVFPESCRFAPNLQNLGEAIYFSFVTGTTLGYGDIRPTGTLSRILGILETSFVLLVVLVFIASVRGSIKGPKDIEHRTQ